MNLLDEQSSQGRTYNLRQGEPVVIAIDPGRAKLGVAVVERNGRVREQRVVQRHQLADAIGRQVACYQPQAIVVGDRTGRQSLVQELRRTLGEWLGGRLFTVDEDRSSLEARARYLKEHPARGWRRLLPLGLRLPDRPIDDYTAVILAERFWQGRRVREVKVCETEG